MGVWMKFPCGGGEGAVHSSVVASHGLSFTFSPCQMLQKKLTMNGIWARPMIQAAHEIVHLSAGRFREPIINPGEKPEDCARRNDVMEMRDDVVGVVQIKVG